MFNSDIFFFQLFNFVFPKYNTNMQKDKEIFDLIDAEKNRQIDGI